MTKHWDSYLTYCTLSLWEIYIAAVRSGGVGGSAHSSYLNVRNMWFAPHNVASINLNLNQKSEECS
jgi:hypothetical protein